MTKQEFFGFLLQARTTAHLLHFQTTSYAKHIALEEFYTQLLVLTDELIEATQGLEGIYHITVEGTDSYQWTNKVTEFLRWFYQTIQVGKDSFTESYQTNVIEDIETLAAKTIYKLTYLH